MSRNFLTPLALPAGTASLAPLTLQSGTNLTSAAAGAVEYDGKVIYSTPSGRGVSPSMMLYRLDGSRTLANNTTSQSLFGVGLSLSASTIYLFQCAFKLSIASNVSSHTISFQLSSSTSLSTCNYQGTSSYYVIAGTSAFTSTNTASFFSTTRSMSQVAASVTTGSTNSVDRIVYMNGTLSISSAVTITPSIQCSTSPGNTYSVDAGQSYFAIWPIGAAGANTSVGPWA